MLQRERSPPPTPAGGDCWTGPRAGRAGLLARGLGGPVEPLRALGARHEGREVTVGHSVCGSRYEVPAEVRQQAGARARESVAATSRGAPGLDLRAGAAAALAR